ncbi:Aste57867_15404 [Aphanomyces stellatus]|uniref:Aste57867_15404 protein n=1 Tax=Aphanomyces stellatus TaxID=120398 RepID=A0A485L316_9STRA|nr:hypothetical protein As57867_015348 [Aphanomyces stellatus]VFT92207.1 Aste57867_15404 [Aphanomyces stellatus]
MQRSWPHAVCCVNPAFACTYVSDYLSLCLENRTTRQPRTTNIPDETVTSMATLTIRTPSPVPTTEEPEKTLTKTPTLAPRPTVDPKFDCSDQVKGVVSNAFYNCASAYMRLGFVALADDLTNRTTNARATIYDGKYGPPCDPLALLMIDPAHACYYSIMMPAAQLDPHGVGHPDRKDTTSPVYRSRYGFFVYDNLTAQTYNGTYAINATISTFSGQSQRFAYHVAHRSLVNQATQACLAPNEDTSMVSAVDCDEADANQRWTLHVEHKAISHDASGLCMEVEAVPASSVSLKPCHRGNPHQYMTAKLT